MKCLLAALCLLLPSCVFKVLDQGLADLKGKPIETAFDVLGYPSSKLELGNDTVYKWNTSFSSVMPIPQVANTTGLVGATPFQMQTTSAGFIRQDHAGEISIGANKKGVIQRCSYYGTERGLHAYAECLDKYSKSLRASR
ncbi:MAG: hypothetical protein HS117_18155 [Verrucomicrobiaceae bacterium]|nr:hypothetical protein [Verrucomicrobiaceae bacterium]